MTTAVQLQGWEYQQLRTEKKQREAAEFNATRRLRKAIFKGIYTGDVKRQLDREYEAAFGDYRGKLLAAEVSRTEHLKSIQKPRAIAQGLKVDSIDLGSMRADGQKNLRAFLKAVHKILAEQGDHTILASELILSDETGMPTTSVSRYLDKAVKLGILKVIEPAGREKARRVSSLIEVTNEEIDAVVAQGRDLDVELKPDAERIAKNAMKRSKFREAMARARAAIRNTANEFLGDLREMFNGPKSVLDSGFQALPAAPDVTAWVSPYKAFVDRIRASGRNINDVLTNEWKRLNPVEWRHIAIELQGMG